MPFSFQLINQTSFPLNLKIPMNRIVKSFHLPKLVSGAIAVATGDIETQQVVGRGGSQDFRSSW